MDNRNIWSKKEDNILANHCNTLGRTPGYKAAAKQLGRTEGGCKQHWDKNKVRLSKLKVVNTPEVNVPQDGMTVTYHNGVTKPMRIIAKTNSIVVAKVDDVVITIEL